jgi:hypothetical protein
VASGWAADINQWLPAERLEAVVQAAGAGALSSPTAINAAHAAVLQLHTALVSRGVSSPKREVPPPAAINWQALQPSLLLQAYDATTGSSFWATVLALQLLEVGFVMMLDQSMNCLPVAKVVIMMMTGLQERRGHSAVMAQCSCSNLATYRMVANHVVAYHT